MTRSHESQRKAAGAGRERGADRRARRRLGVALWCCCRCSRAAAARTCTTSRGTEALEASAFFADGAQRAAARRRARWRAARCRTTTASSPARSAAATVTELPFPITRAVLDRGQERFNIYCAPCHDAPATATAWSSSAATGSRPRSTSSGCDRRRAGYFFDVITNGFGAMPDYRRRSRPRDRWAHRRLHPRAAAQPARARACRMSRRRPPRRRSRHAAAGRRGANTDAWRHLADPLDRRPGARRALQQRALIVGVVGLAGRAVGAVHRTATSSTGRG